MGLNLEYAFEVPVATAGGGQQGEVAARPREPEEYVLTEAILQRLG